MFVKKLMVVLLVIFALSGCGAAPCSEQSEGFIADVEAVLQHWIDADQVAGSTSRIALDGPIQELQAVRRDALAIEAPECAADVKSALIEYMDDRIDIYLMFMSNDESVDFAEEFKYNETRMATFAERFRQLKNGGYDN